MGSPCLEMMYVKEEKRLNLNGFGWVRSFVVSAVWLWGDLPLPTVLPGLATAVVLYDGDNSMARHAMSSDFFSLNLNSSAF